MDIYFVRHGQTAMNARHIHQMPEEPLDAVGRGQAAAVGTYLQKLQIDTLFASPLTRTRDTAEIIESCIDVPIRPLPSVVEFQRPDALYGKKHASLDSFLYLKDLFIHRYDPEWTADGMENMYDIRNRIHDAKQTIGASGGERVVVVSHAIFMNLFVEMICNEVELTFFQYFKGMFNVGRTRNTDIFHLRFDPNAPANTCAWELVEKLHSGSFAKV